MSKHNKSGVSQKGQVAVLGIDLSKNSFQLHGVDARGKVVIKKKLNRKALLPYIANLPQCLIAIEACGGSHYLCRKFTELGHDVRIIAPQFVKPYVKSNKNDAADAEAICEAAQRPNMRFVPSKNVEQQDICRF
ncbi:transposase [Endozoicomonas sp.]|uniref:IS110 family transposase n=1 Tax=Endozoicomonas sp. TaxID=1892382 RepID=UPI003839EF3F